MTRKRQVLVQFDPELLGRVDAHAAVWMKGNRSRLIGEACEQLLAQHAVFVQRQSRADPRGGWLPAAPRRSADTVGEAMDRPLTADLMDGRG